MSTDELLKTTFRAAELTRRVERRKHLLNQIANELACLDEPLTEEELGITQNAIVRLSTANMRQAQQLAQARLGYWGRLWYALLGKVV